MTPTDPAAQLGREVDADPVFQFRARKKTDQQSVEVAAAYLFDPAMGVGRDLDAARVAHRPTSRTEMAREARRLAAQGLTARDVAAALRLSDAAVVALLEESQP
jgi:hypothetical protein